MDQESWSPSHDVFDLGSPFSGGDPDTKELLVFPWSGVIQNISCTSTKSQASNVGTGDSKFCQFLKELNPHNAQVFRNKLGQPDVAIVQFKRDSYKDAKAFHHYFTERGYSRKDWLRHISDANGHGLKCNLYGWLASAKDYYGQSGNEVATYLQATAELKEVQTKDWTSTEDEYYNPIPSRAPTENVSQENRDKCDGDTIQLAKLSRKHDRHWLFSERKKVKDLDKKLFVLMSKKTSILEKKIVDMHRQGRELEAEREKVKDLEDTVLDLKGENKTFEEALDRNSRHAAAVKESYEARIDQLERHVQDLHALQLNEDSNDHLDQSIRIEELDILDSTGWKKFKAWLQREFKGEPDEVQVDNATLRERDTDTVPCRTNLRSSCDNWAPSVAKAGATEGQTGNGCNQVQQLTAEQIAKRIKAQSKIILRKQETVRRSDRKRMSFNDHEDGQPQENVGGSTSKFASTKKRHKGNRPLKIRVQPKRGNQQKE